MSSNTADQSASGAGDRADATPASRSDAGVGGAVAPQADPNVAPGTVPGDAETGTQDVPAMHGNDTTTQAKIDGIVAQTRADFPEGSDPEEFAHALRRRFSDTAIAVDDEQIRRLAGS